MDTKDRFSNKVEDYVKYRSSYPCELIEYLADQVGLSGCIVADVGAGTGILTRLLAPRVETIFAVEPNSNMRAACIKHCSECSNCLAIDGSAENTTLPDRSVDFVTAAQAFHWFDRHKAKVELRRILKRPGRVILIWNSKTAESDLVNENDDLCRLHCPEFGGFSGRSDIRRDAYDDFFGDGCEYREFENNRVLTLESYIGGSLSASYAPTNRDKNYRSFVDGLTKIFHKHSVNDRVILPQFTRCYVGEV